MASTRPRWPVQVRMSDLGERGHVMPHRLLEWCQDAATLASAAAGYDTARYVSLGTGWYIRAIVLDLPGTVAFGNEVQIETWVSGLRRFRSRREYVVHAQGNIAARAQADWLYLRINADTGKVSPCHFDEEMQAAFPVDTELAIAAEEVADFAPTIEPTHTAQRIAYPSEADRHGHVNHVHYFKWLADHVAAAAPGPAPLRQLRLQYQTDVRPGDTVQLQLNSAGEDVQHRMMRGDDVVARAVTRFSTT